MISDSGIGRAEELLVAVVDCSWAATEKDNNNPAAKEKYLNLLMALGTKKLINY
jgi:hypothetical protein